MTLYIDTTNDDSIEITLKEGERALVLKKFEAKRRQAEELLPAIENLIKLKSKKTTLRQAQGDKKKNNISRIVVNNVGGSFTALRIGVVTANALAYAWNVPVEEVNKESKNARMQKCEFCGSVLPVYDREPNITKKSQVA